MNSFKPVTEKDVMILSNELFQQKKGLVSKNLKFKFKFYNNILLEK